MIMKPGCREGETVSVYHSIPVEEHSTPMSPL